MINKKLALDIINLSLETGADYSEIFYEDSHASTVMVENGKVNTSSSSSLCGVGLRLLKGNRSVYGYTNDLSKNGLTKLAKNLYEADQAERFKNLLYKYKINEKSKL